MKTTMKTTMKTAVMATVAAFALAAAVPALAQTPPASTDKPTTSATDKPAAAPAAAKPAPDKPLSTKAKPETKAAIAKDHTLTGTVKAYDAASHMLTFSSGKEFKLADSITDSFKAGDKVKVHYTMSGGKRSADTVSMEK